MSEVPSGLSVVHSSRKLSLEGEGLEELPAADRGPLREAIDTKLNQINENCKTNLCLGSNQLTERSGGRSLICDFLSLLLFEWVLWGFF